jgi:hypothetical protein
MTMKRLRAPGILAPLALIAAGCVELERSSNPLSPTVAGPIPGVAITSPTPRTPNQGSRIPDEQQPLTLMLDNATTSGVRPLSYSFEVATDRDFLNRVFERQGVAAGEDGRTSLRLPDPLATGRTYFWRAKAEDGANSGPYSFTVLFTIFTPIVLGKPTLVAPIGDITDPTPRFTIRNVSRSGPVGPIEYSFELATDEAFSNTLATWVVAEMPSQTTLGPLALAGGVQLYWRVNASDPTTTGPWSDTKAFKIPVTLAPPPPPADGGGGGNGANGHIPRGSPLNEATAKRIAQGTFNEFPSLSRVFSSEGSAVSAAEKLMLRTIWHLRLAGFQAGRQRNPSNAISKDKLTIRINGKWRAYDIFRLGTPGNATRPVFLEMFPAEHVPHSGIPD